MSESERRHLVTRKRVFRASSVHPATDNRIFHKECAALSTNGREVHLCAVAEVDETKNGIYIHALLAQGSRLRRGVLGYLRIWKNLRQVKPDLLHVHDPGLIPLALFWRVVSRHPAVYDSHEDLPKAVVGKSYLPMSTRRIIASFAQVLEWAAVRGFSLDPPVNSGSGSVS